MGGKGPGLGGKPDPGQGRVHAGSQRPAGAGPFGYTGPDHPGPGRGREQTAAGHDQRKRREGHPAKGLGDFRQPGGIGFAQELERQMGIARPGPGSRPAGQRSQARDESGHDGLVSRRQGDADKKTGHGRPC